MTEQRTQEVVTAAGRTLLAWLDDLESIAIEWAPAHSAPYVSKSIVAPIVDLRVREAEQEAWNLALAAVEAKVAGMTHSGTVWTGDPLLNRTDLLRAIEELRHD